MFAPYLRILKAGQFFSRCDTNVPYFELLLVILEEISIHSYFEFLCVFLDILPKFPMQGYVANLDQTLKTYHKMNFNNGAQQFNDGAAPSSNRIWRSVVSIILLWTFVGFSRCTTTAPIICVPASNTPCLVSNCISNFCILMCESNWKMNQKSISYKN